MAAAEEVAVCCSSSMWRAVACDSRDVWMRSLVVVAACDDSGVQRQRCAMCSSRNGGVWRQQCVMAAAYHLFVFL